MHPLTNIQALRLVLIPGTADHGHKILLDALPQLTALQLDTGYVPQEVVGLTRLQRFAWSAIQPKGKLPGGPWLAGLRKLMLPGLFTAHNVGVLRQATQLEHLALHAPAYQKRHVAVGSVLLQFVGRHASLRCLQLSGPVGISKAAAARAMQSPTHPRVLFTEDITELLHEVVPEFYDEN